MSDALETVASDLVMRSPLDGIAPAAGGPDDAGVALSERRFLGKLILRGDGSSSAFQAAVKQAIGCAVPTDPNTTQSSKTTTALWLSPEEWLITTAPGEEAGIAEALRSALSGQHSAVTDISDNVLTIRLSGPNARHVLMKGCSLDFHPSAFAVGHCAQTHLVKAVVTIQQIDNAPSYDIHVRRSFAEYLWRWLEDAGLEYGVRYP